MAYARSNPVVESLSELGRTLREATGDVLTRKRLDLQEQTAVMGMEQERDLARLRTAAQQQAGETNLLKTRSDITLQEAQNRRAEETLGLAKGADVRAGESHGLQMKTGEFQLEEGRTLLPGKVELQRTGAAMQRASTNASNQAAHASGIRAQVDQFALNRNKEEYAQLSRPIKTEDIMGELQQTMPEFVNLFKATYQPGETTTALELTRGLKMFQGWYSAEASQMEASVLARKINDPNTPAEERPVLQARYRSALELAGKRGTPGDERVDNEVADLAEQLKRTSDPVKQRDILDDIKLSLKVKYGMKAMKGEQPTSMNELKKVDFENAEQYLFPALKERQGYMVGGTNDKLIDVGLLPKPSNYVTANDIYPDVARTVKPATSAEWNAYRKGDPTIGEPGDQTIDTQQKADQHKRDKIVMATHGEIRGNRQQFDALMQRLKQPQTPGATPPRAPVANAPTGRTAQEITAQLQNALGRDPSQEEINARFQELMNPPGLGPGIGQSVGQSLGQLGGFLRQRFQGAGQRASPLGVRQEITGKLQQELGRDPSPEEVEARYQQLLTGGQ